MNENVSLIKEIDAALNEIQHNMFPSRDTGLLVRASIALKADTEFHKKLNALRMAMVELFMLKMDTDPKSPDVKKVKKMLKSKQKELLDVIFDFLGEDDE